MYYLAFPTLNIHNIFYHSRLANKTCVCEADEETIRLPFSNLLFPRVWAHNLHLAFLASHPDAVGVESRRAQEYNSFKRRLSTDCHMSEATSGDGTVKTCICTLYLATCCHILCLDKKKSRPIFKSNEQYYMVI